MKKIVFNGHADRIAVTIKEDGEPIDFSVGVARMTLELIGRGVVADSELDPTLITWDALGNVYFKLGLLGISVGTYKAVLTVYDASHPEGQVLLHPLKALLEITVADDNATVLPGNRTCVWSEKTVPELVTGDSFFHTVSLLHGSTPAPYNFVTATLVRVSVISADHSARLTEPYTQVIESPGADWTEGNLAVILPSQVTATLVEWFSKRTTVKLEIEITIGGNQFTWFAPLVVIPGTIN